jgi:hypothetical protein
MIQNIHHDDYDYNNRVKQSASYQAGSRTVKRVRRICNCKVDCCPPNSTLSHVKPIHILTHNFSEIHLHIALPSKFLSSK